MKTNKQTNYVTFLEIFLYPLPIPLTMPVLSSLSTSNLNDTPTNSLIRRNNYSVLFIIDNILWWNYWIIDPYESLRHRRERTQRVANGDTDEGNQYNLLYKSLPTTTSHSFLSFNVILWTPLCQRFQGDRLALPFARLYNYIHLWFRQSMWLHNQENCQLWHLCSGQWKCVYFHG